MDEGASKLHRWFNTTTDARRATTARLKRPNNRRRTSERLRAIRGDLDNNFRVWPLKRMTAFFEECDTE